MEWGEQANRLSIHSLSLSNKPGLPWKPLYACSLITLTPYTYSLIHRESHRNTKRHKHTLFFLDPQSPSPLPCIPTQSTSTQPHRSSTGLARGTHSRHQQLLDLVDGPLEFDLGPVVRVLHRDQDVEVLAQVLPVGLPPVHLLLEDKKRPFFEMGRTLLFFSPGWQFQSGLQGRVGTPPNVLRRSHKSDVAVRRRPSPSALTVPCVCVCFFSAGGLIDIRVRTPPE